MQACSKVIFSECFLPLINLVLSLFSLLVTCPKSNCKSQAWSKFWWEVAWEELCHCCQEHSETGKEEKVHAY